MKTCTYLGPSDRRKVDGHHVKFLYRQKPVELPDTVAKQFDGSSDVTVTPIEHDQENNDGT